MFTCPVCEYEKLDADPILETYDICDQCGTEFGYNKPSQYQAIREAWIGAGMPFWEETGNWPGMKGPG